jgi:hypothetical protein
MQPLALARECGGFVVGQAPGSSYRADSLSSSLLQ